MKIWYSAYSSQPPENEEGFVSKQEIQGYELLEASAPIIRQEVLRFVEQFEHKLVAYFNDSLVPKRRSWKAFTFQFWGWKMNENCRQCPETVKLLRQISGLVSASVSILEPGAVINRHRGDTNAIRRCHLGLVVPIGLPDVGFICADETKEWREGELLVFDDSSIHQVWNNSDQRRIVLMLDVIRPEFKSKKLRVMSTVLGIIVTQLIIQKIKVLKSARPLIQRILGGIILIPIALRAKIN